ncbi:MAG: hypothetical protein C0402_00305 [Thermodesulfovibrio sp.]|nr:hypothetical protein [Thermodesulfovibrio sp.]
MKKRSISVSISLLLIGAVSLPVTALSVSYPVNIYHRQGKLETAAKGDTVHLFHSGTADVRKTIHINDLLTVYRTSPSCEATEVGKVRVLAYVGDTYVKAEVVEGWVRPDDIAKIKSVSCLVIYAGICEH